MAKKNEQEVFELLRQCIPEIEESKASDFGGISFKYNGATYYLECTARDKNEVEIYKDNSKYLPHGLCGVFSNPYGEGWNFNFADIGMPNREPFFIMLDSTHTEDLKEYLDALAHTNKR